MSKVRLLKGDCLIKMKKLKNKSIDLILSDLPYGTQAHKWDEIIPFNELWREYDRIIKDNGVIVLFATQPFTTKLIASNYAMYRYSWIWLKDGATNFLNVNYAPLKTTEDICVFSKGTVGSLSKNPIRYYPQEVERVDIQKRNNPKSGFRKGMGYKSQKNKLNTNKKYVQKFTNYPKQILEFRREVGLHPTQKPVALCKYLIKTYTHKGDMVLDNCMGSGSVGVACVKAGRNFIGIELNGEYFDIAEKRISSAFKLEEK